MPEFFIYMDFLHFPLALTAFIIAMGVSLCACSPVICTARTVGAMDIPRDGRRMHDSATPRAGGLAIFSGFAVSVFFYSRGTVQGGLSATVGSLLCGMALMVALGFCDDVFTLPPRVKLAGQACVAIIPLAFGVYAKKASLFGLTVTPPPMLSVLLSFLWILVVTNALNLIDGLNGLASGVVMIAAATLALRYAWIEQNAELSVMCAKQNPSWGTAAHFRSDTRLPSSRSRDGMRLTKKDFPSLLFFLYSPTLFPTFHSRF